jgi:hypothetical protein
MCMFCKSLFVLLSFFFWPLCCLSFFDLIDGFWLHLPTVLDRIDSFHQVTISQIYDANQKRLERCLFQRWVQLVEQLSSPPIFSGIRVTRSFVLFICVVVLCLSIVLSDLLWCTDSDSDSDYDSASDSWFWFWFWFWFLILILILILDSDSDSASDSWFWFWLCFWFLILILILDSDSWFLILILILILITFFGIFKLFLFQQFSCSLTQYTYIVVQCQISLQSLRNMLRDFHQRLAFIYVSKPSTKWFLYFPTMYVYCMNKYLCQINSF